MCNHFPFLAPLSSKKSGKFCSCVEKIWNGNDCFCGFEASYFHKTIAVPFCGSSTALIGSTFRIYYWLLRTLIMLREQKVNYFGAENGTRPLTQPLLNGVDVQSLVHAFAVFRLFFRKKCRLQWNNQASSSNPHYLIMQVVFFRMEMKKNRSWENLFWTLHNGFGHYNRSCFFLHIDKWSKTWIMEFIEKDSSCKCSFC